MVSLGSRIKGFFSGGSSSSSSSNFTPAPTQSTPPRDFGDTTQMTPSPSSRLPQQSNIPKSSGGGGGGGGGGGSSNPITQATQNLATSQGGSLAGSLNKPISTTSANTIASQLLSGGSGITKSTRTDLSPKNIDVPIYSPGTIYQFDTRQRVGKDKFGRSAPIINQFIVQEDFSSRPLTIEEETFARSSFGAQRYEEVALSDPRSKASQMFGETKGSIQILSKEPVGFNSEQIQQVLPGTTGGIVSGFIPSTKGELVVAGLTYGVGAGAGALFKGGALGLSKLAYSNVLSKGFKVGGTTLGIGATTLYGVDVGTQLYNAEDLFSRGQIIGKTGREVLVFGAGYRTGAGIFREPPKIIKPQNNIVTLEGVTQRTDKGLLKTDAYFSVDVGGKTYLGIVSGKTKELGFNEGVVNLQTGGLAKIYKQTLEFPTGRIKLKEVQSFKLGELGYASPKGEFNLYRGAGKIDKGDYYVSESISKQIKRTGSNYIIGVGGTKSQSGSSSLIFSKLKVKPEKFDDVYSLGKGKGSSGNTLKSLYGDLALDQVGVAVGSKVNIIPKTKSSFNVLGSGSNILQTQSQSAYAGLGLYERTESFGSLTTRTSQLTRPLRRTSLGLGSVGVTALGLDTGIRTRGRSGTGLSFATPQALRFNQAQVSGLGLGQGSRTRQSSRSGLGLGLGTIAPTIPISPFRPFRPRTPFIPQGFALGLGTSPGRSRSLFGSFNPRYTPSLTGSTFNLRGIIPKSYRTGNVGVGIRPISINSRRKRRAVKNVRRRK